MYCKDSCRWHQALPWYKFPWGLSTTPGWPKSVSGLIPEMANGNLWGQIQCLSRLNKPMLWVQYEKYLTGSNNRGGLRCHHWSGSKIEYAYVWSGEQSINNAWTCLSNIHPHRDDTPEYIHHYGTPSFKIWKCDLSGVQGSDVTSWKSKKSRGGPQSWYQTWEVYHIKIG